MKLVFVSNFMTHHQKPLSDELFKILGRDYAFVQTEEISKERKDMGWELELSSCPYLLTYYNDPESVQAIIDGAEIVIIGGASDFYIKNRIKSNRKIVRCEERPFKKGGKEYVNPRKIYMMLKCHVINRKKNMSILCAGAYVSKDMKLYGAYPHKKYSWGYFPPFIDYGPSLNHKRNNGTLNILWSGRMIGWKHPELAVSIAEYLRDNHILFSMKMIGTGTLSESIEKMISEKNLNKYITIVSAIPYTQMPNEMHSADIFLMTSDRQEGWGAVANEAMNNGAVLIGNTAAGAIPFLIDNGVSGFCYSSEQELKKIVLEIATNPEKLSYVRENAYQKIKNIWNPHNAAVNLVGLLFDASYQAPFEGPCSPLE